MFRLPPKNRRIMRLRSVSSVTVAGIPSLRRTTRLFLAIPPLLPIPYSLYMCYYGIRVIT